MDYENDTSSRISAFVRELREKRQAQRGMPAIVLAYAPDRGVLAAVEQPDDPVLARGVLDFLRDEGTQCDPKGAPPRAIVFQNYNPTRFRKPVPRGRQRPRRPNGIITDLASRLIVPEPVGIVAVFVDGQEARYRTIGQTPGAARVMLDLQRSLAAGDVVASWFRAGISIAELYESEQNPLREFFKETANSGDEAALERTSRVLRDP